VIDKRRYRHPTTTGLLEDRPLEIDGPEHALVRRTLRAPVPPPRSVDVDFGGGRVGSLHRFGDHLPTHGLEPIADLAFDTCQVHVFRLQGSKLRAESGQLMLCRRLDVLDVHEPPLAQEHALAQP
jgi:hypothetical protein